MEIAFFASEMAPFSKAGGLGDVIGTLPRELSKKKVKVNVLTPGYGIINYSKYNTEQVDNYSVEIGEDKYNCHISRYTDTGDNYRVYFVKNDSLFNREGIYTDDLGAPYEDNFLRYLFFQLAGLKFLKRKEFQPDIIHCHDNQTALIPAFLEHKFDFSEEVKTIFTLHNIGYQGIVDFSKKKILELPEKLYKPEGELEWYGQINPVKAGILLADKVTTVSETHAKEISNDKELSAGLNKVIKARDDEVVGILNGIDYTDLNPESDDIIPYNYSLSNFSGKGKNKEKILEKSSLTDDALDKPLIGMVSRLVEQKGIEILLNAIEDILSLDIKFILLGSGEKEYHLKLKEIANKYPDKIWLNLAYDPKLSRNITAASDIFLMPSRYEPCGLTQMAALRYGTIVVAHKTGGLNDTIEDGKTGFLFEDYSGEALFDKLNKAVEIYHNRTKWEEMIINSMNKDFSWKRSVNEYIKLYRELI